jgi:hypothetical protein
MPRRMDADGKPLGDRPHNNKRFEGKPREEYHPMDKKDGTGRGGRRPYNKRDGEGQRKREGDEAYKKKGDTEEAKVEGEAAEVKAVEPKVEEPKVITKTEVIGISMDDFFQGRQMLSAKEARAAEALKVKTTENNQEKTHQSTVL